MIKIESIYDVFNISTKEDQATNFLLWLLHKLPAEILHEFLKASDLQIGCLGDNFNFFVQYGLQHGLQKSRADGLIKFADGKNIIIETKLWPDSFNKEQFYNHYKGASKEFSEENIWLLFLSGDKQIPDELKKLKTRYKGRIGFISWIDVIRLIKDNKDSLDAKYKIIIDEFLNFTNDIKLWRLISMNTEEMKKFLDFFPTLVTNWDAATEKLNSMLDKIKVQICDGIIAIENKDEIEEKLQCLYRCLTIKDWHTKRSAYIYLDAFLKQIGVVLTGYENIKERKEFLKSWDATYKNRYKKAADINSFTWVDKHDDDYAIESGYFKMIEGSSGKLINPEQISELEDCFYFGYYHPFEIEKEKFYSDKIPKDFKKLLDLFLKKNNAESCIKKEKSLGSAKKY